jgi:hypothetical protein
VTLNVEFSGVTLQYDVQASRNSRDDDLVFIDRPLEKIDERHESESETDDGKVECDDVTQESVTLDKVEEEEVAGEAKEEEKPEVDEPPPEEGDEFNYNDSIVFELIREYERGITVPLTSCLTHLD